MASISTPSSFLVRNMSPRYQGTEMVMSRSLQDTTLSPLKRWGWGMAVDTDMGSWHQKAPESPFHRQRVGQGPREGEGRNLGLSYFNAELISGSHFTALAL